MLVGTGILILTRHDLIFKACYHIRLHPHLWQINLYQIPNLKVKPPDVVWLQLINGSVIKANTEIGPFHKT